MRPSNGSEQIMRAILEREGFDVQKIDETDERRGDYRVKDNCHSYIVEVKDKQDCVRFKQLRNEMRKNGSSEGVIPLKPSNTIASVIRDAADQLNMTPGVDGEFRIIWFSSLGNDAKTVLEQAELTLYGTCEVFQVGGKATSPCYYFYYNEFFKIPHVDAAILFGKDVGWTLCLNSFSSRHRALKSTKLASLFSKAIRDPIDEEAQSMAFLLDEAVDRSNPSAITKALCRRYGLRGVSAMVSVAAKAMIAFPDGN